ncbi:hypothetical protein ACKA06_10270 [Rossellomorea oryzaecorticis]|uniref:Uncharacterized protein n=1 Tax=Rossellomorea oryzaecorticis TaxID=1396505 RepID=A0ABW8VRK3_9BACI
MLEGFNSKHFMLQKVSPNVYAAIAKEGSGSAAKSRVGTVPILLFKN